MYRTCIIVFTALFLLTAVATAASAQSQPAGITVNGTANVQGKPDVAFINLAVQTEDKDAGKAAQANATVSSSVIEAVIRLGIPQKDIRTSNYSISPIIDYQKSSQTTVGYRVTNTVEVKIHDLTKIGSLIDTAVASGANDVQNIRFAIDNDTPLRQEALVLAIHNAEAKAKTMADTLGVKLGKVTSVTESGGPVPSPIYGMAKAAAATPILAGELTITSSVTVVYSIL